MSSFSEMKVNDIFPPFCVSVLSAKAHKREQDEFKSAKSPFQFKDVNAKKLDISIIHLFILKKSLNERVKKLYLIPLKKGIFQLEKII